MRKIKFVYIEIFDKNLFAYDYPSFGYREGRYEISSFKFKGGDYIHCFYLQQSSNKQVEEFIRPMAMLTGDGDIQEV